jgi:multidrug efflux system membrane fusion protein
MRRLLLIAVVLAVCGGAWWRLHARGAGAEVPHEPEATPVLVATAEKRDVPIWLDGLGTAQASATVTIKPQVDGVLTEVRFREGQDVRAGDVLARIDPRTYQAALDQAAAKKAQDAANLANARVDLGRYSKLAVTAYTSAQQADTQRATVAQLEAQVAQDQAAIDNARAELSYTTITAPIDGRTGIRQVDQGNLVHASDTGGIVVITTLRPIAVIFTLPQQDLPAVAAAQAQGAPEALALAQGAGEGPPLDRGTLAVLDNQVDPSTGTIKLKAMFPNERLRIWPGAFVTVRLRVDTRHDATVVPPAAVQRGPSGPYVYVVGDDLAAHRRPVTVGHEELRASIVEDGLRPGERVVVDGAGRLTDGAKVSIGTAPEPGGSTGEPPKTASRGDGGAT